MKNVKQALLLGVIVVLTIGCSSSASEDFEDVNGQIKKKRLKSISAVNKNEAFKTITSQFSYDSNDKLINVSGTGATETVLMNYNNDGSTIKVTNGGNPSESFSIEELYKSPYAIYERGEVLEYDSNKNPSKISFQKEVYDYNTGDYSLEDYTAEMLYDDKANLYFATLEAAGIIDILDSAELSFGINPQAAEVIKARALFPINNLIKVVYKNADNNIVGTLNIDYTYDTDGYPVKGMGTVISENESVNIDVTYSYY